MPFVRQCEVLLGKTDAMFWLGHDVPSVRQFAADALALAEQVPERPELKANAMAVSMSNALPSEALQARFAGAEIVQPVRRRND